MVAPDLRGYGDGSKPPAGSDHAGYSKRAMAANMVGLMSRLGHEQFLLAGHDRGARVAHRLCRDYPERVASVAVLDIAPTLHMYETADREFATAYYHWFFLIQPADLPERMIGADPAYFLRQKLAQWGRDQPAFSEAALAECISGCAATLRNGSGTSL